MMAEALLRVFIPLAGMMINHGVQFGFAADRMKEAFVRAASKTANRHEKSPTISQLSLLSGLQRKDVKAICCRLEVQQDASKPSGSILAKVIAHWRGEARYCDEHGQPKPLSRQQTAGVGFVSLVKEISRDVHPRTILDELIRRDAVQLDAQGQLVTLHADAMVAESGSPQFWAYLGANLGDHASAALGNQTATEKPPFFERAAHYDGLSAESVTQLREQAAQEFTGALLRINKLALRLQAEDQAKPGQSSHRFRAGAFLFHEPQ